MITKRLINLFVGLLLVIVVGVLAVAVPGVVGQDFSEPAGPSIVVEIAENGTRFLPDETPIHPDGLPAYGAEFITEGYIYPAGTLTCTDNECNGVLADGSPEFPELVLGKWVCRGWHVGDGAHTESGPWVVSTQMYDFGDVPGAKTIVTDGYEYSDFNIEFKRAITGGSGRYLNVRGEQVQEFLGWNSSLGVSLSVELNTLGR